MSSMRVTNVLGISKNRMGIILMSSHESTKGNLMLSRSIMIKSSIALKWTRVINQIIASGIISNNEVWDQEMIGKINIQYIEDLEELLQAKSAQISDLKEEENNLVEHYTEKIKESKENIISSNFSYKHTKTALRRFWSKRFADFQNW